MADDIGGGRSYDALNERVQIQGEQIDKLADDTARQFVDFRETTRSQFASFRADVKGEFDGLSRSIEALTQKIDTSSRENTDRGKVNWFGLVGTLVTSIGVSWAILTGVLSLRLTPIENDLRTGKENQTAIVASLDKITGKLDSFETRAELTARNMQVDAALAGLHDTDKGFETSKVSTSELNFAIRERNTLIANLQAEVNELKTAGAKRADQITSLQIDVAKATTIQAERSREINRIGVELDRRATSERVDDLRDRLGDQRERISLLSNRLQNLYDKNYATPRQPCLDSGAGCGPISLPGPAAQPAVNGQAGK